MNIPNVDFAIVGGSGTLSSDFPKNFQAAQIRRDKFSGRFAKAASKGFCLKAASALSIACSIRATCSFPMIILTCRRARTFSLTGDIC